MYRLPRAMSAQRRVGARPMYGQFWRITLPFVTLSLLLIVALGTAFLHGFGGLGRANASSAQSISVTGTSGDQQVNLSWSAVPDAQGYQIQQTDLATGTTQVLPDIQQGTSFSPGSLAVGHWYRFSVIPLTAAGAGTPSQAIEIRTKGFQQYDHYYALGDLYTAGNGAPPYMGATGCYRSANSYSFLLGNGAPTPDVIACSGAVTADVDQVRQLPSVPGTQLSQLHMGSQVNALITITIGGNDVSFANELKNCIESFTACTSRRTIIANKITALEPRLAQVYQEIRQAAPGADIFVVGYPLLVADPAIASCHNPLVRVGLSSSEMTMIRQLAGMLDGVISQAASQAGVVAVTQEVEQAFAGHEACTKNQSNEWVNEIAGLNDLLHDSFHPNRNGYLADSQAVNASRTALYQNGMVRQ